MEDKTLLNISLLVSFTGLIILTILSYYEKIPHYEFNEITNSIIGEKIEVDGKIVSVREHNSSTILRLENKCYIDIYVDKKQNFIINSNIKVEGVVEEYNTKISIRAEKILVINN